MSNPNEDQWNGQTGQPNQSQPNQPNPAVNRANRSMVRMTAIMAANILRKVRRERKTLRISMRRTASHKATEPEPVLRPVRLQSELWPERPAGTGAGRSAVSGGRPIE